MERQESSDNDPEKGQNVYEEIDRVFLGLNSMIEQGNKHEALRTSFEIKTMVIQLCRTIETLSSGSDQEK